MSKVGRPSAREIQGVPDPRSGVHLKHMGIPTRHPIFWDAMASHSLRLPVVNVASIKINVYVILY
jgi:hypothetical protein